MCDHHTCRRAGSYQHYFKSVAKGKDETCVLLKDSGDTSCTDDSHSECEDYSHQMPSPRESRHRHRHEGCGNCTSYLRFCSKGPCTACCGKTPGHRSQNRRESTLLLHLPQSSSVRMVSSDNMKAVILPSGTIYAHRPHTPADTSRCAKHHGKHGPHRRQN